MSIDRSDVTGKRRVLGLFIRGLCMGTADVIPGVSGGTIALITGIYDDFVGALASVNSRLFSGLFGGRFGQVWTQLNGSFLLPLLTGIAVAIKVFARPVTFLLETYPVPFWGFLTGLIAASAIVVGRRVSHWKVGLSFATLVGVVVGYFISTAVPYKTGAESYKFFLSGSVASVAMILPGISGSFILLLLGKYQQVFQAIAEMNLKIIATFGAGFVVGILSFAKLLKRLLASYYGPTMTFLVGLMVGSLRRVWPFREPVDSVDGKGLAIEDHYACTLPSEFTGEVLVTLVLTMVGAVLVFAIEAAASRRG